MPVILKIIHNEDFNAKQKPLAMETGDFSTGETPSPQKLNWRNSISWRDLVSSGHGHGRNSDKI